MFVATHSTANRPARRRPDAHVHYPAVEALDARRLLSVSVPAGYVQVDSLSLDAYTLAAQTFDVTGGRDYFFKATGTHVLAQNPTRRADAAGYESAPSTWTAGTHLHVKSGGVDVVSWGLTHASDSEYGATYTPSSSATLTAVVSDSFPSDNSGTLDLDVYVKVFLVSLTVTQHGGGDPTATDSGGSPDVLLVTPDGFGEALVAITAGIDPNSAEARNMVIWAAYNDDSELLDFDTFDAGGDSITFGFYDPADTFTLRAGVDTNGNGVLDLAETTRTITVGLA